MKTVIKLEDIKSEIKKGFEKEVKIIYINYSIENGIKILDNIEDIKEEELKDFYKIHIFNEEMMKTVIQFGDNDYRIEEISIPNGEEKSAYLVKNQINQKYNKIRYRIGNIEKKYIDDNGQEEITQIKQFQYIGLE